jgi:hypothetical protein
MEVTINQIIDLFKFCADGHYAIVSYGYGDRWELPFKGKGEARRNYPILWVTPLTHRIQGVQIHRRFRLIVGDVVRRGEGNEQEVESDTERWLTDIIAVIRNTHPLPISVELLTDNIEITPFTESSGDNLTGHYADITLKSDYKFNKCEAAGSWLVPPPPPLVCQPANYIVKNESGDILAQGTISSGSSKTITVPDGGDAIWELVDTDGNVLATGFIPAGGSATITAPDSTIENSDGSYLVTVTSGGNLTLPDVDILVVDINDNPLDSATIPSVKNHTIDVVCVAGTVDNSDQSYSTTVASGGALVLPDQTIEVNGVNEGNIPSVGTIEVELNDDDGNPFTPQAVNITGRKIDIEIPKYEFDINLIDRFGNAFPTKQVTSNATWDLRTLSPFDWADLYLSRLTNPPTGAQLTAVYTYFADMVSAGLFQGSTKIELDIGGNAADHSWNARYPFDNNSSMKSEYVGSPTHDANGVSLNGTSQAVRTNCYVSYLNDFDKDISIYIRSLPFVNSQYIFNAGNGNSAQGFAFQQFNARNRYAVEGISIGPNTLDYEGLNSLGRFSSTEIYFMLNNQHLPITLPSSPYTDVSGTYNRVTEEITIGALMNKNLTFSNFATMNYCYIRVGSSLNSTQQSDHYNIVQALQTAYSRNV